MRRLLLAFALVVPGCGGSVFTAQPDEDGGAGVDSGPAAIDHAPREDGRVAVTGDVDAGVGGSTGSGSASGGIATGGVGSAHSTGGVTATGGVSAAGGVTATGGMPSTGGTTATGGTVGAGGAQAADDGGPDAACTLVTHSNGLGQTWQDCAPIGTYNEAQAMKACEAAGAAACQMIVACGPSLPEARGSSADGTKIIGRWGYAGSLAGYVGTGTSGELCLGVSDPNNRTWR